jgi:hypothetical protein
MFPSQRRWHAAFVAAALFVSGCAPVFVSSLTEHPREGLEKTVVFNVHSYFCGTHGMTAKYRLQGTPTWTTGGPALRSGSTGNGADAVWAMRIIGSDGYRIGDVIETLWDATYDSGGWFCPEASDPGHVTKSVTSAVTRAFNLTVTPSPAEVPRGGTRTLTASIGRVDGFASSVTVTIGGLPAGVTVTPASVSTTTSTATFTLTGSGALNPTSTTATADASSATYTGTSAAFTINAARPAITAVNPAVAPRSSTVVVTGSSFHSTCSLNQVRIGGVAVVPTSCTATTLTFTVPPSAALGAIQLLVEAGGLESNRLPFTVGREPGSFTEITYDVQGEMTTGRVCGSGEVRVDITGAFTAAYKRVSSGAQIGSSVNFEKSTGSMTSPGGGAPVSEPDLGGAGFSLCNTGVVLDANALDWSSHHIAYRFLRLDTGGSWFSVPVNYFSALVGVNMSSGSPRLHRSRDGTVFAIVTPSETTDDSRVLLLDRESGAVFATIEVAGVVGGMTAIITADNKVVVTKAGVTHPAVVIP